ncbi:hypothetical protein SAMN04489764_3460 [Thermostaphylospora chromogena]|uniref:Uncharacterized protein n=1 Tax=Thermostaphylospora chromogena TaxID=35622 RepID=A0A1H1GA08_9ACTN|nr:hypothetical protein SAMN04489764_3460 [Thermostaphylospora chromogena]
MGIEWLERLHRAEIGPVVGVQEALGGRGRCCG